MAKTKNFAGPVWNSETNTKQSFIILSDHQSTEYGLKEESFKDKTDKSQVYTGQKAVRIPDELPALIKLTKRPKDYPYDFVLL